MGTTVLRLFGDCDAATETGLRMQLRRAAAAAAGQSRHLVVDLSDVPFMDAAGLAALMEAQALTGNQLTIRNPPWALSRIIDALHFTGYFTILNTRIDSRASTSDGVTATRPRSSTPPHTGPDRFAP